MKTLFDELQCEVHQTPHIDSEIHIPTFDLETRALSDLSPGSNTF